jgi:hypothetical protein
MVSFIVDNSFLILYLCGKYLNMETPFVYGRMANKIDFTDRAEETARLITNFNSRINSILISPRRWGKSSLVAKASEMAMTENPSLRICFIDLYNVRSEEEFYQLLAQEVIRVTSSKFDEMMDSTKRFLGQLFPKLSYSPEPNNEFSLGFDWNEVKKNPNDILNLAENIALDKNISIVICIDEFQNISEFENPLAFQKKLRSHWQKHQKTTYCLYGSKRHMLLDVFTSSSMPFYKFGDIIFLQKIKEDNWVSFITKRFIDTKKKISDQNAAKIAQLTKCHSYYVQQLAQQAWLRTKTTCNEDIVMQSFENLTLQMSLLFQTLTDELSTSQVNFLKALTSNETRFSSKELIDKYRLGTSGNIQKIKKALENKEVIDCFGENIEMLDPIYEYWMKKYYFKTV